MATASVGFSMPGAEGLIKQLDRLALEVRDNIAREAIEAGMVPVESSVRAITPESSGSRERQSASAKSRWAKSRKLKTTIRSVTRVRRRAGIQAGIIGLVGPSYSEGGGHGNLFAKDHKRKVLWGRDTGTIRVVNQFVKRAADQSRARAETALVNNLKRGIDRAARATTNG